MMNLIESLILFYFILSTFFLNAEKTNLVAGLQKGWRYLVYVKGVTQP